MKTVQGVLATVVVVLVLVIWLAVVVRPLLPYLFGAFVIAVIGRSLWRRS
jgi:hypothetical protein